MDNSFQTSFIPKNPIENDISRKKPVNIFTTITVSILILTVLGMAGLFFYKIYLTKHKETLSASLLKARDSFEKETIDELDLFSRRAEIAKQILNEHIVLSPVLTLIGEITIPSVQYTKFDHQTTDKGFLVKMSGLALDYKSIALQSEMFNSSKGRFFKNVVFSNLVRNSASTAGNSYISFNIEFNIDPSLLSYDNNPLLEAPTSQGTTNFSAVPQGPENNIQQ